MNTKRMTTHDLCLIAIFVAMIAVLAQITIPLPYVPLTMQTFAIALAGVVLGAKRGAIAAGIYLLLAAIGVPVLSGFGGGFGILIGPSGGYLLSFPVLAFLSGFVAEKAANLGRGKFFLLVPGLITAMMFTLVAGSLQLAFVMQLDLVPAFLAGMVPFIVPEMIKVALVVIIAPRIQQVISTFD